MESYSAIGPADGGAATSGVKTQERVVNEMALSDPLATQALFPVASLHEMAGATFGGLPPQKIRMQLLTRLRNNPAYVTLFATVFGAENEAADEVVTLGRLVAALAAFERRFIFTSAPWDRYLEGEQAALTAEQKRGALLFFGAGNPAVNCASCHSGDLFTDQGYHNLLVPQLGPGRGHGYSGREDWGRAGVTFDAQDRYTFRTPSLRNVELTAPYFHTGALPTLEAVIRHHADIAGAAERYDPSDHAIPPDLYSSFQPVNPAQQLLTAAPELRAGLPLSQQDIRDLTAFLLALTDPAARDLMDFVPTSVPSGLPLDPLPEALLHAQQPTAPAKPDPEVEAEIEIEPEIEAGVTARAAGRSSGSRPCAPCGIYLARRCV